MKYTLRQLEVFLAVAHTENISRAAAGLAMSQSAASGALSDLERQFDIQLFDRLGKRLQINELGCLLRPRAEALLDQARELELALSRHADVGQLKLTWPTPPISSRGWPISTWISAWSRASRATRRCR